MHLTLREDFKLKTKYDGAVVSFQKGDNITLTARGQENERISGQLRSDLEIILKETEEYTYTLKIQAIPERNIRAVFYSTGFLERYDNYRVIFPMEIGDQIVLLDDIWFYPDGSIKGGRFNSNFYYTDEHGDEYVVKNAGLNLSFLNDERFVPINPPEEFLENAEAFTPSSTLNEKICTINTSLGSRKTLNTVTLEQGRIIFNINERSRFTPNFWPFRSKNYSIVYQTKKESVVYNDYRKEFSLDAVSSESEGAVDNETISVKWNNALKMGELRTENRTFKLSDCDRIQRLF